MSKEEFMKMYRQYYPLLYSLVSEYLQEEADRLDVLQEVFLYVWEHPSKITEPVCPKTKNYLCIISTGRAKNLLKRRNGTESREVVSPDEFFEAQVEEKAEFQPEQNMEKEDTVQVVTACIKELPENYRECLYLSVVEERNSVQVAEELNLKPAAAKKRIQRGMKLLRKKLRERGYSI